MVQRYTNIPNSVIYFDFLPLIEINKGLPLDQIVRKYHGKLPFDVGYLADQVTLYQKGKHKLPSFVNAGCFITPQGFEQASSEYLAEYKAKLIKGETLLDLSAGLGIDDWAFCKTFQKVVGIDVNHSLNQVAIANFKKLGIGNYERLTIDAESYLNNAVNLVDVVYIDADRRVQEKRMHALANTSPNVLELLNQIFRVCQTLLLKVSPMLDLHEVSRQLKGIKQIQVVAFKNEVKELLLEVTKVEYQKIAVTAVELNEKGILYQLRGYLGESALPNNFWHEGTYFYEPGLAIIKAGLCFELYANKKIYPIAPHSVYGLANHLVSGFEGRVFKIVQSIAFSKKNVVHYLQNQKIEVANIAKRHFPIDVNEIRKQFKLKEGGQDYLFFTTDSANQKRMYHCTKIDDRLQ